MSAPTDHRIVLSITRPRRGSACIARRPMAPGRLGGRMEFDGRIVVLLADDVPDHLRAIRLGDALQLLSGFERVVLLDIWAGQDRDGLRDLDVLLSGADGCLWYADALGNFTQRNVILGRAATLGFRRIYENLLLGLDDVRRRLGVQEGNAMMTRQEASEIVRKLDSGQYGARLDGLRHWGDGRYEVGAIDTVTGVLFVIGDADWNGPEPAIN